MAQEFSTRFPINTVDRGNQAVAVEIVSDKSRGSAVTVADGDDFTLGNTNDAPYSGQHGDISTVISLLKGIYEHLDDVMLSISPAVIGRVILRDNADTRNVTPLSDEDFINIIGSVDKKPSAFTVMDRLKTIADSIKAPLTVADPVNQYTHMDKIGVETVRSGSGFLDSLVINSPAANGKITIYDSTTPSGTKIAAIEFADGDDPQPVVIPYHLSVNTGITLAVEVKDMDITIIYR